MLADRFQATEAALQAQAQARAQASADRDAFIAARFPTLDTLMGTRLANTTGVHPRLAVVNTPLTDTFTNRGFATMDKTVREVRSTLFGPLEAVRFTPLVETGDADQFGLVRVEVEGGPAVRFPATGQGARFRSLLERGIVMRGRPDTGARLMVADEGGFTELSDALLEEFLAAVLVRA